MFVEYWAQGEHVKRKQKRAKNGSLWDTTMDRCRRWSKKKTWKKTICKKTTYFQNRYPIMVKCLNIGRNIGKPIYRSISNHDRTNHFPASHQFMMKNVKSQPVSLRNTPYSVVLSCWVLITRKPAVLKSVGLPWLHLNGEIKSVKRHEMSSASWVRRSDFMNRLMQRPVSNTPPGAPLIPCAAVIYYDLANQSNYGLITVNHFYINVLAERMMLYEMCHTCARGIFYADFTLQSTLFSSAVHTLHLYKFTHFTHFMIYK